MKEAVITCIILGLIMILLGFCFKSFLGIVYYLFIGGGGFIIGVGMSAYIVDRFL